jgi:N-hydroxyarylamine O-acetyltransferase
MTSATNTTLIQPERHLAVRPTTDERLVQRYLDRLGVDPAPPSVDALTALHCAHVERVPYETFWLHLGQRWGVNAEESMRHIALEGRGGYCFHLNGAFAALLARLGYSVTLHRAGVHETDGPNADLIGNHVTVTVHDLPTDNNPAGMWYVDLGLGAAIHTPLPLTVGSYRQGPTVFTIGGSDGVGDWSLTNDPSGSFTGVSVLTAPVELDVFAPSHDFNTTSPESGFAKTVTAQRRDAHSIDIMRGCVLTHRTAVTSTETFERRSDWLDALADVFALQFTVPSTAIEALWGRVRDAHETWVASAVVRAVA